MSHVSHPSAIALAVTDELTREAVSNLRNILGDTQRPAPEIVAAYVQTAGMIYAAGCMSDAIEKINPERLSEAVEKAAGEIAAGAGSIASELGYLYGLIEGGRNG